MRFLALLCLLSVTARADLASRKAGLAFGPYPTGPRNQITDVAGVTVGHVTLKSGEGRLKRGVGPIRTGVTVVVPTRGDVWRSALLSGVHVANGIGEAAGFFNVRESRLLRSAIGLTNTLSVGDVHKGLVQEILSRHPTEDSPLAVVLECDDSSLNDIHGLHVKPEHAIQALRGASESFKEGAVGAGTGMISFDFKSGIGSTSRVVTVGQGWRKRTHRLGVLVNANLGTQTRHVFRFMGVPLGGLVLDLLPIERPLGPKGSGSIVIVVATDAPLDSVQLSRLAQRSMNGVARLGAPGYNGSGDFVLAFSTANRLDPDKLVHDLKALSDSALNEFFEAIVDATEEAVINSLLNAETTNGRDGNVAYAFPTDRVKKLLPKR